MKVDYLLVGAGMAGLVLRKFLQNERTVLIDQNPGAYKIGESVVPEQFTHPVMRALVPKLQQLPSYSPKYGTTFVNDDSIASFPLPPEEAGIAMHIARPEIENLMIREWNVDITKEKVLEVDPKNHVVRTNTNTYEVEKQIIDCSGPAMVVGSALKDVSSLWPVWATWSYWDVEGDEPDRFWAAVQAAGKKYLRYDAIRRQVLQVKEIPGWSPGRTTILSNLGDGLWCWQIPLRHSSLVSLGVVSRHGPVSREQYYELARKGCSPNFQLKARPEDGSSIFNRVYSREGFARRCGTAATMDYILLADAYGFADPVYSVGTAVAVNKAIELADILNHDGWNEEICKAWNVDAERQLKHAISGFEFWYSGELLKSDAAANDVRDNFLLGTAFQAKAAEHYGRVLKDASLHLGPGQGGIVRSWADGDPGRVVARVRRLLELGERDAVAGWSLVESQPRDGGVLLRWSTRDMPDLTMDVELETERPCFLRAGRIGLSFMNSVDGPYPFNGQVAHLFDAVSSKVRAREAQWIALPKASGDAAPATS